MKKSFLPRKAGGTAMLRNKKNILLALFLLSVAAGVYYPISKIISFEFPLTPPTVCRFRATFYDPYDPFRGRYVALQAEGQEFTVDEKLDLRKGTLYAVLEVGEDGMAKVAGLAKTRPPGKIVIKTDDFWFRVRTNDDGKEVYRYNVSFPFKRFYMNEKLAPEAERIVMEAMRGSGGKCLIVAKVFAGGEYAISDLEIDGVPIYELLERKRLEEAEERGS